MSWRPPLALFICAVMHTGIACAMDCPPPPQNVAKEIVTDTEGSVNGLRALVGGALRNRTEITAKNLFEKYPNADRITVATLMMSVFCQQIDRSTQLSDKEKLDQLNIVNDRLIGLMTAPAK
jgi:hypothetical protein